MTATNSLDLVSVPSDPSSAVSPQAPAAAPDAPTQVTAVVSGNSAVVSWTGPETTSAVTARQTGEKITGYEVTAEPGPSTCTADAPRDFMHRRGPQRRHRLHVHGDRAERVGPIGGLDGL